MFLINGVFFQQHEQVDVLMLPGLGATPVGTRPLLRYTLYAGLMGHERGKNTLVGGLMDQYGSSVISGIVYDGKRLEFTKRYVDRDDDIRYTFKRKSDGRWVGKYKGHAVGTGLSHCYVVEVPDDFIMPDEG